MDDETFSTSRTDLLSFSTEVVDMDTCFSTVPTPTKTFWVYNNNKNGIRCSSIRLMSGNQTGFRVNVDGVYLGSERGYQLNNQEIRHKDSIRVFVELTTPVNGFDVPTLVEDNLLFTLESGVQQKVNLKAYSWDADLLHDFVVSEDYTLSGSRPTVIYGKARIEEGATLTIAEGKTVYMHADAGFDVYGTLKCQGTKEHEVILRGDRLDHMFDYLPYDGISGQWKGITFHEKSYGNELTHTDLHGAMDAIVCDSSNVSIQKLTVRNSTIHNNQGCGIREFSSKITLENTLISNCLTWLLDAIGGDVSANNCTFAQFYPFDYDRGAALFFTNSFGEYNYPLVAFNISNSIATGYAEDVVIGISAEDESIPFNYNFSNCFLRTETIEENDHFHNIIWDDVKKEEKELKNGEKLSDPKDNFQKIDTDQLQYDFHLKKDSRAIDKADKTTSTTTDRDGTSRDERPDIGCYEYVPSEDDSSSTKE